MWWLWCGFPLASSPVGLVGVGTTYQWVVGHPAGFELVGLVTRQESVVNERIVDSFSTEPVSTWTPEPDGTITSVTLAFNCFAWRSGDRSAKRDCYDPHARR